MASIAELPICVNHWSSSKGASAKTCASSASLLPLMEGADDISFNLMALMEPQLTLDTNHPETAMERKGKHEM